MYRQLPKTRELAQFLKPAKNVTRRTKLSRILMAVIILGCLAVATAVAAVKWAWFPKRPTGYFAISSIGVVLFAWIILVLIDVSQNIGTVTNPAGELSDQFDNDIALEGELLLKFRAIPTHILLSRHQRLELQLAIWDKWLDTARLMGLLGPPLIFIGKEFLGNFGSVNGILQIETMVSAALTGVLVGAISMRSGMRRLHRVSHLLKRASDQNSFRPQKRERRKRL